MAFATFTFWVALEQTLAFWRAYNREKKRFGLQPIGMQKKATRKVVQALRTVFILLCEKDEYNG